MGRIFLYHGPPNTITDRPNEPSAYPYQIWHYYKIGKFNNKRFIFYKPDLGQMNMLLYILIFKENTLIEIGKQIYIEEIRLEEVLTIFKTLMMDNGEVTVIYFFTNP